MTRFAARGAPMWEDAAVPAAVAEPSIMPSPIDANPGRALTVSRADGLR